MGAQAMTTPKKVLIMAGGTGGHIMPGLAVAEALMARGVECAWLGRTSGMEADLVSTQSTIRYYPITTQALRGKSWSRKLKMPWVFLSALKQCFRVLNDFQPDVVCGFGGYVSAPGGVAAWLRRIPLVVHEQNKIAGMTNRILSKLARHVCESFPETFAAHSKIICTGNPVRAAIQQIAAPEQRFALRERSPLRIAVLGGSQGAKALNQTVPEGLAEFAKSSAITVRHQTGSAMQAAVQQRYADLGIPAHVESFITDMAEFYASADIVIARSGATTVAELAAAGVPSVLIPYPYAVDDHQTANANALVNNGAAHILPQTKLTATELSAVLQSITTEQILLKMAVAARAAHHVNAATQVSDILLGG